MPVIVAAALRAGLLTISLTLALLASAPPTAAQTVGDSSGAIVATVTDTAGGALADVTICVSGPAMMAARCGQSDASGAFRFLALPPGDYAVTLTFQGVELVAHKAVRVGLGETTNAPVTIENVPERAAVTVQGSARGVDAFATTRGARFTAEELASLPSARNMGTIIVAAPGVLTTRHDVGGNTALAPGQWSAYGVSGFSRPTLEGVSVSTLNQFGLTLDYGSFEHVWLGLGAYGPDAPSPGIHMQAVTKSGGNRYSGSFYAALERERWQAANIDAHQIEQASSGGDLRTTINNHLAGYHDLNADVGGFIRKDRVWWYGSLRDQQVDQFRVTFPFVPIETRAQNVTAKLTARVGSERIVLFAHANLVRQPIRLDGFLLSGDRSINGSTASTTEQVSNGTVWKAEWSGEVRGRLFVEARAGQLLASRREQPHETAVAVARVEDTVSGIVSGLNRDWRLELSRHHIYASINQLAGGSRRSHLLKVGGEIVRDVSVEQWIRGYSGDIVHALQNGAPREVYLLETPSRSEGGQWWFTGYASDSWQVTPRLTLNAGLRFDRFRLFLPPQVHQAGRFNAVPQSFDAIGNLIDWNVFAPRLGASYAADSSGRTIVKGTYGRYWLPPSTELAFNLNPNSRTWFSRYGWSDGNGSGLWEPGEERALLERRGGQSTDAVDAGLKLAYMHEATLHIQHEAPGQIVVTTGVMWRGERQQGLRQQPTWPFAAFTVPVERRDPGVDGIVGTDDDGAEIQLYDVSPGLDVSAVTVVRNVDRSDGDFVTWELVAERPFRDRWSLSASFARTWSRDHAAGYLGQPVRNNQYPLTPNDLINTDGGRHVFSVWTAKAYGTIEVPWEVRLTPVFRYQSGQPFGRTFQTQLPNYGSVRVLAEPVGTRRQDSVMLIDLRTEKAFRIEDGRRVAAFVEVFNAFNTNPEQVITWSSGRAFLRPLNIVAPRIARVGLMFSW